MKQLVLASFFLLGLSTEAFAQKEATTPSKGCTSSPCGNTATGEDPAEAAIRRGEEVIQKRLQSPDDKQRWLVVSLYSDSVAASDLSMPVVKKAGLVMSLDPKLGQLSFAMAGTTHTFDAATPKGMKGAICPKYGFDVVDASSKYVLVRRVCNLYEYAPGRFSKGVDYFLYDVQSAAMRGIWRNATSQKAEKLPDAKPTPAVVEIKNGYKFDWSGAMTGNGPAVNMTVSKSFTRQSAPGGTMALVCTDLAAPKGEGKENEICEGEDPARVK